MIRPFRIRIVRDEYTAEATMGSLWLYGAEPFCSTLEPPVRAEKPRAIPPGCYPAVAYNSPRLGYRVILLRDVPGFDMIEIHRGNKPAHTEGCILVGHIRRPNAVLASKAAHDALMKLLDLQLAQGVPLEVEVTGDPSEAMCT